MRGLPGHASVRVVQDAALPPPGLAEATSLSATLQARAPRPAMTSTASARRTANFHRGTSRRRARGKYRYLF